MIKNGVYRAQVWHKRWQPKEHVFRYKMLIFSFDLKNVNKLISNNKIVSLNSFNLLSFREKDHLSNKLDSLGEKIQQMIPEEIRHNDHNITMITQLAHFGFCFNPISFIIVSDAKKNDIIGVILEIRNTPWGERQFYKLFDLDKKDNTYFSKFEKNYMSHLFYPWITNITFLWKQPRQETSLSS